MLADGQYFCAMHPAQYSPESLLMGNAEIPAEYVARYRDVEFQLLSTGVLESLCLERGITPVRYDQAARGRTEGLSDALRNEVR